MNKQPQTILHIDDDDDDRMLVKEIIQEISPSSIVVEFEEAPSALNYLGKIKDPSIVSLIILDINMPGMNGKMLLSKLKTIDELSKIPVVLFTTSSSELDKSFAKKHEVEIITKPLSATKLKEAVSQILELAA